MKNSSILKLPRQWLFSACYVMLSIQLAVKAQDFALDGPPPNKWFIATPEFSSDRLDLFLRYPVSDFIPYEHLDWTLFAGSECSPSTSDDITENDYLDVRITIEDETAPEGTGGSWRFITLSFAFDPDTIRRSPILVNEGLDTRLQFCVNLGAYSSPTVVPGALEIFRKVTSMDVLITQAGQIGIDNLVADPNGPNEEEAEVRYRLRGFLCDENNDEIIDPLPIFQGVLTKVCVTPVDEALADGVYMRAIDSFYWTRETFYQPAILPRQTVAPLSEISCVPGMITCSFVTLLRGEFFYRLGRVYGAGVGWLQFGRGDYTGDQRKMKVEIDFDFDNEKMLSNIQSRKAQENRPEGADYPEYAGAGPFNVDIPVTRLYRAYGWLCDKNNLELDPRKHPLVKGRDKARVCVTPDDIAINQDNVRIRNIDSFTWNREDVNVTQVAISTNAVEEPRTEIFCQPGSLVCAFETDLVDDFYRLPGKVGGKGIVWLQFGEDSGRRLAVPMDIGPKSQSGLRSRQRDLQYGLEDFALGASILPIADPGFAGVSPFDVSVYVLPPVERRELYRCRAYECDYTNKEFVSNEPKEEGDSIRMCVKPSFAAEEVGVKMWSIEWWEWSQVSLTQDAIVKQGQEAPDGRTVQFCYRGMDVCFFQTRLIPDFFAPPQPNALNGNGVCWISFGDGFAFPAPIVIEDAVKGGAEVDPTADPLYAGHNDIAINFPTTGNYTYVEEVCPPEDHTIDGWWEEEDDTMKAIYITAVALASAALCCLWGLCFFCNRKKRKDEETIIKENGNLIINVDVSDTKTTENIIHETNKEHHGERTMDRSNHSFRSLTDTQSEKTEKFSGKRNKTDIAFEDEEHPGTIDLRKKVRSYIRKHPDDLYGPEPYRIFQTKFEDSYFLVRDNKTSKWREAKKSETVKRIGEIWMEEKKELKNREGEYTREDLKEIDRKEKRSSKSDKRSKSETEQMEKRSKSKKDKR